MRRLMSLLALVLLVGACSSDDADTSTSTEPSTPSTLAGEVFELSSPAFGAGEMIPTDFAGCVDRAPGPNGSPPLEWSGVPDGTVELAVTVVDPDADGFIHWVVAGIAPDATGLEAGAVPAGAVEALNDTGTAEWFGPCPPEEHTYVFAVHALDAPSEVEAGMDGSEALAMIDEATQLRAEFSAPYDQDR